MDRDEIFREEAERLRYVLGFIKPEFEKAQRDLKNDRGGYLELLHEYNDMVSGDSTRVDGSKFADADAAEVEGRLDADFARLLELSSFVTFLYDRGASLRGGARSVSELKLLADTPYFGRFDFDFGDGDIEKIYVGRRGFSSEKTGETLVYDWRSPVAAVYYESGVGKASYQAPAGKIDGEVTLRRRIGVEKGELVYAVDTSASIDDDMLASALASNPGGAMRDIVETIQKEQDAAIRDTEHELLIVQGEAGSGKTSVALHRIAFLLYQSGHALGSKNVLLVTPSGAFARYIADVLPSLGERSVTETSLQELLGKYVAAPASGPDPMANPGRDGYSDDEYGLLPWLTSRGYVRELEAFAARTERRGIEFPDIWYGGKCLVNRADYKVDFLENSAGRPAAKRLERIALRLMTAAGDMKPALLESIRKRIKAAGRHPFDMEKFADAEYLRGRETLRRQLDSVGNEIRDVNALYRRFVRETKGIDIVPNGLHASGLLYLSLLLRGAETGMSDVRQVVVDEAQDYTPCFFACLRYLCPDARYTVVGDAWQSAIHSPWGSDAFFADFAAELRKKSSVMLRFDKCYRSTAEITAFTRELRGTPNSGNAISRHGAPVTTVDVGDPAAIADAVRAKLSDYSEYNSIAVITQSDRLARSLAKTLGLRHCGEDADPTTGGTVVLPSRRAKGFEFGAVISVTDGKDVRARYVSATRALHALSEIRLV